MECPCRPQPVRPQRPTLPTLTHKIATAAEAGSSWPEKGQQSDDGTPEFLKKMLGENEYSIKFRLRRWLLFSGLVLGYSFYYLCRNSLNYVNPVMVADPALGLDITKVATLTSIFPIAYGAPHCRIPPVVNPSHLIQCSKSVVLQLQQHSQPVLGLL